jgi:hypothetical protein
VTSKKDLYLRIDALQAEKRRLEARIRALAETGAANRAQRDQYRQWWEKEREHRLRKNDPHRYTPTDPFKAQKRFRAQDQADVTPMKDISREIITQGTFTPNVKASEETHGRKIGPVESLRNDLDHYRMKYESARRREQAAYEREELARRAVERLENENQRITKTMWEAKRNVQRLADENVDLIEALEQAGLRPPVARPYSNPGNNPCAEMAPRTSHGLIQSEVASIWNAGYAVGYRHGTTP